MYGTAFVPARMAADSLNHESLRNLYPFTQHIQPFRPIQPKKKWYNRLYDKVFQENLVIINRPGYLITADPLFDAEPGRETVAGQNTWVNTRGVQAYGRLELGEGGKGDKNVKGVKGVRDSVGPFVPSFEFYTSYYESQGRFPHYIDSLAAMSGGIPGQGFILLPNGIWDHSYATAWTRYTAKRFFTFELGTGKNFFGNGYRSMLLSDNSRNYPYFRIDTKFWRIHYTNLWAEFQDNKYHDGPFGAYQKKYGAFHYLSYSLTNRFEVSFFDAIIWQGRDSLHTRGFEINYLNPVIFLRPVEWTLGSPDNALVGVNLSYRLPQYTILYGQFLIDEFDISQLKAHKGFWGNKFGGQIGAKTFIAIRDASRFTLHESGTLQERGIFLQSEFNFARPYTYSHWTSKQNYGHMGQPLAHPLGANFYEWVSFARLNWGRFLLEGRYSWTKFGANFDGLNYGQDVFLSYDSYVSKFGNYIGQGLSTKLTYKSLTGSFLLNPSSLLNIFITVTDRHQVNENQDMHSLWVTFGVRNSLRNFYYDF
ncbi:MAG: hypothetical protein D4R64_04790 [Porphyromonadaceae bacterium]|nr:MAG: hypothetical protein D4R64_04790 [Porphyromonadaceae bacterium]